MSIKLKYNLNWNANDYSGNGYNWIWGWTASYAEWKSGQSWVFNWSTNYITWPSYSTLWINWDTDKTFSVWIKWDTFATWSTADDRLILDWYNNGWTYDCHIAMHRFDRGLSFWKRDSWFVDFATTWNYSTWNWYHLVVTLDTTNNLITTYFNWVQANQVSHSNMSLENVNFVVWRRQVTNDRYFDWNEDEIIIYNNILSPAEIKNQNAFYNWFI